MRKLIVAIAALLVPAAAFAGGYIVPNVNARDLAMVGAPVAAQDSAGATYQNPAALAKLDGLNISVDVSLIDLRTTWSDPTGLNAPVSSVPKAAFPPALYAAYGFGLSNGMRAGLGFGLTIPGGGFVFWPDEWAGRNEIISVDRKIYGTYLTGGVQLSRMFRLGGGLIYYRTTEHLVQGLNFIGSEGRIDLGTAGGALSYDVSGEFTPVPALTIAVDYKHQGVQTLTGHAHGEGVPAGLVPNLLDQGVTHSLTYPSQLNVGAALTLGPVLLSGDWTLERQVVYQNDLFVGDRGVTVNVPRNFKNDYTFRFGAEVNALPRLRVRGGLEYDRGPQPPQTISPTLPTANTIDVGLGLGYELVSGLELNAGYFHAFYDSTQTQGTEAFAGKYDTTTNIYALNLTWRPGGRPKK